MDDVDDVESSEFECYPTFEGPCTCEHSPEEHGWGTCNVKDCPCEAGWCE